MLLERLFRKFYEEEGGQGAGAGGGSLVPDGGGDPGAGDTGGTGAGAGGEGPTPWFYAEGVEGAGDKPEYFLDHKFKSLDEQAKSFVELEKKFGGFTGAPEGDYELSMPEGIEGELVKDDPLLVGFQKVAKEANMSQDTFTKILHQYVTEEQKGVSTSRDNELSKLGDNAQARLQGLGDWAHANLSEQQFQQFRQVAVTAEAVEVLESIINLTREGRLPGDGGDTPHGMTEAKLKEMKFAVDEKTGKRRTEIDPEYAKEVRKAYKDFYGEEPRHSYVGGRSG